MTLNHFAFWWWQSLLGGEKKSTINDGVMACKH